MTSTQQVAQGLMGQANAPVALLAPAVRWIGPAGRVWCWERPPRPHSVHYMPERGGKELLKVWLPWTVEILDTEAGTLQVFTRNSPLASIGDGLCHLPLPGIGPDGQIPIPKLKTGESADVQIVRAKKAFDQATWIGGLPQERVPASIQGQSPLETLNKWSTLTLLGATGTDWSLYKTFEEFIRPLDKLPKLNLKQLLEKAAGQKT